MKPDYNQLIKLVQDQQKQINDLLKMKDEYYATKRTALTYFKNVIQFDKDSKIGFFGVEPVKKQTAITAPTGGATVDSQSRTAIGTLITTLQTLGLTS